MEGDEVEIEQGVWMVVDVDTPVLSKLTVNGRLSFKSGLTETESLTLNSKLIFVRAGELLIGSESRPYTGQATIKLHGGPNDNIINFSPSVEAGNKVLAVTGMAHFYGKDRSARSRLLTTTMAGDTSVTVEKGLDWQRGDRVVILPTATQADHFDYMTVSSYNAATGQLIFTEPLEFYHWGQEASTED